MHHLSVLLNKAFCLFSQESCLRNFRTDIGSAAPEPHSPSEKTRALRADITLPSTTETTVPTSQGCGVAERLKGANSRKALAQGPVLHNAGHRLDQRQLQCIDWIISEVNVVVFLTWLFF